MQEINRQKALKDFKSHFSADLHGIPAPEEFLNWSKLEKPVHVLKKTTSKTNS